tara:strand:- start:258 stop:1160 length:903 start_codon:yes stop_codon:yes gene_type:complete
MTSQPSSHTKESTTFSQPDFLARIYPLQGHNEELEKELAAVFSTKSCVWLGRFDLSSSYLKTLEISSLTKTGKRSKKSSFKLPSMGTMLNGILLAVEIWEPVTKGNAYGSCVTSLPTPNTMDSLPQRSVESMRKQVTKTRPGRTKLANLREAVNPEAVKLFNELQNPKLPTPRAQEPGSTNHGYGDNLKEGVFKELGIPTKKYPSLPTPTARDHKDCGPNMNYQKAHEKRRLPGSVVVLGNQLPTPCARDYKGRTGQGFQDRSGGRPRQLPDALTRSGESIYLNPHFVEEMMGYPIGYLV